MVQNHKDQEAMEVAMDKTEVFFQENGRKLIYALIAIISIAVLIFTYRGLVVDPRAEKAVDMLATAQQRFDGQNPDYELALNGDANGAGFLEVAQKYGSTPAGNLANHYAGVCYIQLGDFESAANYLKKYSAVDGIPGAIINAQNLGLQGDVAIELGNFENAARLFEKASETSDNNFTTPLYLRKAALAHKELGNNDTAIKLLERVALDYPMSYDAREAEKLLGTIK